jgi:hypothetical protein
MYDVLNRYLGPKPSARLKAGEAVKLFKRGRDGD